MVLRVLLTVPASRRESRVSGTKLPTMVAALDSERRPVRRTDSHRWRITSQEAIAWRRHITSRWSSPGRRYSFWQVASRACAGPAA